MECYNFRIYANHEKAYEVFTCFAIIQKEDLSPNAMTLICILKSCGNIEGIVDSEYVCQVGSLQNLIKCFKSFLSRYSVLEYTYW